MTEEKVQHNPECRSELHGQHLCYFISQGFRFSDPEKYEALVKDPEFKCEHCGRSAKSDKNLCKPVEL